MCEVTARNFKNLYPQIELALKNAKFIAIDIEFSALNALVKTSNSLFNTLQNMYEKMCSNMELVIPLQVGITAFEFNPEAYEYVGKVYTFYLFPRSFSTYDKTFMCQSSSLQFLCKYKFDFNKFIIEGIPFLNKIDEEKLRKTISNNYTQLNELDFLFTDHLKAINKWCYESKIGDVYTIPDIVENYHHNYDLYYLHKYLRSNFKNRLWTSIKDNNFVIEIINPTEHEKLSKKDNLEKNMTENLLGFTHIFNLLTTLQKPIIGHNLLLDLIVIMNNFDKPLPKRYKDFKKNVNKLFPIIYDTKYVSYNVKPLIPDGKQWESNILSELYKYFKDGTGRHLASRSPLIKIDSDIKRDEFHNAGWDSYCTGYIFIRMAHIITSQQFNIKNKMFMSSELLNSVKHLKNCANIIRGSVLYSKLDGKDPVSRRPPRLIIEAVKNKPVDILHATNLLSSYGYVEIKPYSLHKRRAIIAVDNFGSAKRILQQFKTHPDYRIVPYSIFKHNPVIKTFIWGGIFISGASLLFLIVR